MARRTLLGNDSHVFGRARLTCHSALAPDWTRLAVSTATRTCMRFQTVIDLHYIQRKIALGRWCKGTQRLATFSHGPKMQVRRLPAPPRGWTADLYAVLLPAGSRL